MTPQEERLKERLESLGIQVSTHPTRKSPFFYDWELRYVFVRIQRQNIDSALLDFIEELLKYVPVEKEREKEWGM